MLSYAILDYACLIHMSLCCPSNLETPEYEMKFFSFFSHPTGVEQNRELVQLDLIQ